MTIVCFGEGGGPYYDYSMLWGGVLIMIIACFGGGPYYDYSMLWGGESLL